MAYCRLLWTIHLCDSQNPVVILCGSLHEHALRLKIWNVTFLNSSSSPDLGLLLREREGQIGEARRGWGRERQRERVMDRESKNER